MRFNQIVAVLAVVACLSVEAGQDQKSAFVTPQGLAGVGTSVDFGNPLGQQIPADFFGPGSDPFTDTVEFQGAADPDTPCDTDIEPSGSVVCSGAGFPRPCDPVSVEITALDLKSIAPITVTFNGGQDPEQWDVALKLTPGAQIQGQLSATLTHPNGGDFSSSLPIQPRFVFTGDPVIITGQFPQVTLQVTGPWVINVNPNLGVFAPNDGVFVAGVNEVSPGDPNSQVVQPVTGTSGQGVTHTVEIAPAPPTPIPTVSEWSLVIMTVLAFTAGTILFGRRRRAAAA